MLSGCAEGVVAGQRGSIVGGRGLIKSGTGDTREEPISKKPRPSGLLKKREKGAGRKNIKYIFLFIYPKFNNKNFA